MYNLGTKCYDFTVHSLLELPWIDVCYNYGYGFGCDYGHGHGYGYGYDYDYSTATTTTTTKALVRPQAARKLQW